MHDTTLYQYLLGLQSPWIVSRVNLDVTGPRVDVWAEHPEDAAWACPHCAKVLPLYDHAEERTWRHLDSCQFQTYLHARIPRVACSREDRLRPLPSHGARRQGGGYGPQAGASGIDGVRRRDAQGQYVFVAVQPGERAGAAA